MVDPIVASAVGDAARRVVNLILEVRPAIAALIIITAACMMLLTRTHRREILGWTALALVLLVVAQPVASLF